MERVEESSVTGMTGRVVVCSQEEPGQVIGGGCGRENMLLKKGDARDKMSL